MTNPNKYSIVNSSGPFDAALPPAATIILDANVLLDLHAYAQRNIQDDEKSERVRNLIQRLKQENISIDPTFALYKLSAESKSLSNTPLDKYTKKYAPALSSLGLSVSEDIGDIEHGLRMHASIAQQNSVWNKRLVIYYHGLRSGYYPELEAGIAIAPKDELFRREVFVCTDNDGLGSFFSARASER